MNSKNKQPLHLKEPGAAQLQAAELLLAPNFARVKNIAFEAAGGDGELYAAWRDNTDRHLGRLAQVQVSGKDLQQDIWEVQRDIALATLDGESTGPFSKYFFHASVGGKPIEARPGKDVTVDDLPEGDYDVVQTNNEIVSISRSEDDPLSFLNESLKYAYSRRKRGGGRFEGPENYATAMKLFTDKTLDQPLEGYEDMERAHKLLNDAMGNFLRVSQKDTPNIVELMNVLVSVRSLPKGLVDRRFTPGLLKYTLEGIDDFGDNGMNIILGAMSKMDLDDCPEAAAMTMDLVLRKGVKMHRSGDMLIALRAVSQLPKSDNSEHTVTSLFDVRNALEMAGDIADLVQMNRLLLKIVNDVSDNPNDTRRAKDTAEYNARRASDMLADDVRARRLSTAEQKRAESQISAVIDLAKRI